jgi:hypothetical protein
LAHDAINAAVTVSALRSIKEGDHESAVSMLENAVDGAVVTYWGYSQLDLSRFDPKNRAHQADRVIEGVVAAYRREYPSMSPYEEVRDLVSETVARLQHLPTDGSDPTPQ